MSESKRRPRVGDEVVITNDRDNYWIGMKGILIDDDKSSTPYHIRLESKDTIWIKSCETITPRPEFDFTATNEYNKLTPLQKPLL